MHTAISNKPKAVVKIAGDSGDGIQVAGSQFTFNAAMRGNDVEIFPDFPAEIRAPQGSVAGVSGFQIHFGNDTVFTPGDQYDVLVAMNAAAFKAYIKKLRPGGVLIANTQGFDSKNLRLAGFAESDNPLLSDYAKNVQLIEMDITAITRKALEDLQMSVKEKDRSRNMFVLGFLYWMFNRELDSTLEFIRTKFSKDADVVEANIRAIKAGFHYGDTIEAMTPRFEVEPARIPPGTYRSMSGNNAVALGFIAASLKSNLKLFLGSYPITPASDVLHELAKYKNYGVITFQAEDEIAAITAAIGAAYGGSLAVTTTSGPGMSLKTEAMGLATMLELPLIVVDIQRGGPSTGLPTKTEQADLLMAMYARHGEAPLPVLAARSPGDCFYLAYEACRIAVEHMTPVILLTDGALANGAQIWRVPNENDLKPIVPAYAVMPEEGKPFLPYQRNEMQVRPWAIPGMEGLEHRIGGLEKADLTGDISYDPDNHEKMVKIRAAKVNAIAGDIPLQDIDSGEDAGKMLVVGWGSTYGSIKLACRALREEGLHISHVHIRYMNPFPKNLGELLHRFDRILIPEMNNGQLVKLLRSQYLVPAEGLNKIKGTPFTVDELMSRFRDYYYN